MQRLRRATPIALALFLALVSGAFAGANAGATFSLSSAATVSGVGPSGTVTLVINGSGLVGVKQLDVYVEVSDAAHFNLAGTTMTPDATDFSGFFPLGGQVVSGNPNQVRVGTALLDLSGTLPGANGDVTFSVNLKTSATFTTETEATISVARISLGPSSSDRDEFTDLDLVTTLNPPITDPVLVASTATDISADFSDVGKGNLADNSAGEVTVGVLFTDASGANASGQAITWTVANSGAERIFILGATTTTVAAGSQATITGSTNSSGVATIVVDSEGGKAAGSTSASVRANTAAQNSAGATLTLQVDFSVTWDVPVPAELASFAGEVTSEQGVVLRWAVASQTNNLGWEVYRSVDNRVFERISPLISGEGTTDVLRTYEFTDTAVPATDLVYYYLRQVDLNGSASRSEVIAVSLAPTVVEERALPNVNALLQNYPNPFNPETTIRFDLAKEAFVSLRVYDATGQLVRTLIGRGYPAGSYTAIWDGSSELGVRVGSGVYFYELRAETFTSMKKMTLIQ